VLRNGPYDTTSLSVSSLLKCHASALHRPLLTADTLDSEAVRLLLGEDFEWPNLPILVFAPSVGPVSLLLGALHRFEVVLKRYERMPNNVVVRFVVQRDDGNVMSDYYYLLAP